MAAGPDPPPSPDGDVRETLRELVARVAELEVAGERLRESLAKELRTGRVVVVADDGHERIVLTASDGYGQVTAFAVSPQRDRTCVELFVTDPMNGDGAEVGVELVDSGTTVASLSMFEGRRARLWIDDDPSRLSGEQ
jgi:hypothetical protein